MKKRAAIEALDDTPGWEVLPTSRWRVLADWTRAAAWLDHTDTFAWDDPLPAAAELRYLAEWIGRRASRRLWHFAPGLLRRNKSGAATLAAERSIQTGRAS